MKALTERRITSSEPFAADPICCLGEHSSREIAHVLQAENMSHSAPNCQMSSAADCRRIASKSTNQIFASSITISSLISAAEHVRAAFLNLTMNFREASLKQLMGEKVPRNRPVLCVVASRCIRRADHSRKP